MHENIFSILLWDTSNLVILAWKLGCFIVRQPNKYSCFGGPCHPEDLAWMFGVAGRCWMEGAGRGCFPHFLYSYDNINRYIHVTNESNVNPVMEPHVSLVQFAESVPGGGHAKHGYIRYQQEREGKKMCTKRAASCKWQTRHRFIACWRWPPCFPTLPVLVSLRWGSCLGLGVGWSFGFWGLAAITSHIDKWLTSR